MTQMTPNEDLVDLAQRLFVYEAARGTAAEHTLAAVVVSDKLRRPLSRLAGTAGFASLLARALTLAKAKVPALSAVRIAVDGSLDGLNDIGEQQDQAEAGVILIAELLVLLAVFVGHSFVVNIVLDTWPDLPRSDHTILEKN